MMSSVVSRILRCKPAAFRLRTLQQHYYTAVQRPEVLGSIGQVLSKQAALPLHRHSCSSSSQIPAIHVAGRYTRWWKAVTASAAAAALVSVGAVVAHCSRYIETVPYTDRIHLIVRSTKIERQMGDLMFRNTIAMYGASSIVDPLSPESVRVCRITCQLVRAIRRGLVVRSLKQGRNPEEARRQVKHLDGLHWVPVIFRDKNFRAAATPGGKIILHSGCFDHVRTDAEIACVIAHEIGHVVARYAMESLYMRKKWIPSCLRQYLRQRNELEADYIGILLVGAAGYDPRVFPKTMETILKLGVTKAGMTKASATHPSPNKRIQILSQDKIMEEALELHREVKAIASFCLTLKSLATSPRLARFLFE